MRVTSKYITSLNLLSPSWTFQYISDTLNYLTSSKRACLIRISGLCAFSALILGSSSSPEYTVTSPSPEGRCTSHFLGEAPPTNLSPQHRQFLSTILSITFYLPSLEWALWGWGGGTKSILAWNWGENASKRKALKKDTAWITNLLHAFAEHLSHLFRVGAESQLSFPFPVTNMPIMIVLFVRQTHPWTY